MYKMAAELGDAKMFKSRLDERSRKRARDELNELNDKDRELAVQSFRQWALEQKWLRTPTDFQFLLRFLRVRKFSQLLARETLENYWTAKTTAPEWFRDVDPSDPTILALLRTGMFIVPKAYDSEGRRIIIKSFGKIDMDILKKKWGVENLFKTMCLVFDWLMLDENVQVNGVLLLIDDSNITLAHIMTPWTKTNLKRMLHFFQNSLPCRLKGVHVYNQASLFDVGFALFSPFMKQKLKDRLHVHGQNMVNVYPHISQDVLPQDYLPDDLSSKVGTVSSIVEEMITDMNTPEFRGYIKHLSSDKFGVDLKDKDKDAPVASFRKLNVD